MRQPALAHGAPLCQEASQGGMAFFVTSNEESGKAARVLRAPALFLLALIGGPRRRRCRRRRRRHRRLPRRRRRRGGRWCLSSRSDVAIRKTRRVSGS